MESLAEKIQDLRSLVSLLVSASEDIIEAWQTTDSPFNVSSTPSDSSDLPSQKFYDARRTVLGAIGQIVDHVQEPRSRCMELAAQHLEARAFHIAVEKRIPDLLNNATSADGGVSLETLSKETGIQAQKLGALGCPRWYHYL